MCGFDEVSCRRCEELVTKGCDAAAVATFGVGCGDGAFDGVRGAGVIDERGGYVGEPAVGVARVGHELAPCWTQVREFVTGENGAYGGVVQVLQEVAGVVDEERSGRIATADDFALGAGEAAVKDRTAQGLFVERLIVGRSSQKPTSLPYRADS